MAFGLRSFVAEDGPQDDKEFVVSVSDKSARLKAKGAAAAKKSRRKSRSLTRKVGGVRDDSGLCWLDELRWRLG
jgi:hypothetical protein